MECFTYSYRVYIEMLVP